jgi:RNA polymerase sigma-70 factor (ECF subfamily)
MCPAGFVEQALSSDGLLGIFIATRPALLRYLMLRGASADEADDILQEVYLKLAAGDIGPVAEARAYLYRVTNNHFLDRRRSADRRARREEDWVAAHGEGGRDEQPSAEARIIAREQLAILQRVLDRLPERTRGIFRLFRIEGEPQRKIAADLGISVSAVEKHLTRAYEAIAAAKLRLDVDRGEPQRQRDQRDNHGT